MKIKRLILLIFVSILLATLVGCGAGGDAVRVTTVSKGELNGLAENDIARLAEIKKNREARPKNRGLNHVIEATPNYTVSEYLEHYPQTQASSLRDYRVGAYDVLDITVYEEEDLSRQNIRVSGDGYISFPLVGRLHVDKRSTSEIEHLISTKLAEGQFLLDAHVSVTVSDFKSSQFIVSTPLSSGLAT